IRPYLFLICGITVLFAPVCQAQEKSLSLLAEGKYFSVYGPANINLGTLLSRLSYSYLGDLDSLYPSPKIGGAASLGRAVDELYLEVQDILDIHIYSYHGTIKI